MQPKFLRFTALVALIFAGISAIAQKAQMSRADSLENVYLNTKAKNVYFELFGPGLVYSLNYDTRFGNRRDGLGARAGIAYYADDSEKFFTVPVVLNYLLGKKGKYFEVGAGVTFYTAQSDFIFFNSNYNYDPVTGYYNGRRSDSGIFGTLNFGYRYQPIDGGFAFRTGVSQLIHSNQFIPFWPYVSFGYTF